MNQPSNDDRTNHREEPQAAPPPSRAPGRNQWIIAVVSGLLVTLIAYKISRFSLVTSLGLGAAMVVVSHLLQATNRGR